MTGGTKETDAVAVVLARQEAGRVGRTVASLRTSERIERVVVVDGGSTDGTVDEASAEGAETIRVPGGAGKGGALEAALQTLPQAPVYLLVDADVEETAANAVGLLEPVLAGDADLAIGVLPPLAGGGFGLVRRLAEGAIRGATGARTRAPLSGQRAVTRAVLSACRPFARGFGLETAMTIDALRLGFRVVEVDVEMRHRATGRSPSGFVHRARQGLDVLSAAAPRLARVR